MPNIYLVVSTCKLTFIYQLSSAICIVDLVDLWMTNRKPAVLPLVEELCELVNRPLANSEKVSISQHKLNALLSGNYPNICSNDHINTLFTVGEEELEDPYLISIIYAAALLPPPHAPNGTEYSFVSFWDDNIRKVIEILIPSGKTIRTNKHHDDDDDDDDMEMQNFCPDFGFLLGNACPFRGEEKGPENAADPRAELVDKLCWVYSPAPYMLGKHFPPQDHFCHTTSYRLVSSFELIS